MKKLAKIMLVATVAICTMNIAFAQDAAPKADKKMDKKGGKKKPAGKKKMDKKGDKMEKKGN